ncbi:MAG: trigger factor [bacterium]|nr:trigger factor [bacterium]
MKNVKEFETKIEGKAWSDALNKAFNTKKKDLKVDGFRKGNCPKDIYIKKFGIETLFMDAVDNCINDAYHKILDDNKLVPVCEPKVDIKNINADFVEFAFTVIERPEVKLGKYQKLGVKKEKVEVTDEEVEHELMHLKEKYADIVELDSGKVEKGFTAVINFSGVVDGKVLEGGTGENYPLEIGSNTFIPGFEDGLIGMEIGEEKVLKLKFPEEYVENLKGKDVEFTVKVTGLKKRVLPEMNEDFFKDLGYENVKTEAELKEEIKKHLLEHKEADAENKYIDELLRKASENIEVEINPEIIENEQNRMIDDYRNNLKMQGLSLEQYLQFTKSSIEDLKKQIEPEATSRVKIRYLLEEVSKKENVEVTDEEVKEEVNRISTAYNVPENEVIDMIGGEEIIKADLKMRKAVDIIKEN